MPNVQLSSKEAIKVFIEQDTNRILGFAPENASPLVPPGIRYKSETLQHAADIECYVARYREQQERDATESARRRIQREGQFRKAIKNAILERNQYVSPLNRDLNNVLIRLMDEKYDRMIEKMTHPQVYGMAEAYDADATAERVALDTPYAKHGPERIADGQAVAPDKAGQ